MRIIAVTNQKGGVGKTTTALNLVSELDAAGERVLLVDLDPQASASLIALGGRHSKDRGAALAAAMCGERALSTRRIRYLKTAKVAAAGPALREVEARLQSRPGGGQLALRRALDKASATGGWDTVVIDTPPGNLFLINCALAAAQHVVIPTPLERLALDGLAELSGTITEMGETLNPGLTVAGILPTRVSASRALVHDLADELHETLPGALLDHHIREDVAVSQSDNRYRPVARARKSSRAAADYAGATTEIMSRIAAAG